MPEAGPSEALHVRAPAKINLFLEVLGKRPDGYHEIRTIMQAVSLYDELEFRLRPDGRVVLRADGEGLPPPEENLVVRAAHLLKEHAGCELGADIYLRKAIPAGGGLGGGSSDCAATLRALSRLWNLHLAPEQLMELGARLGSDVPFFVRGGTALCEGRGERVRALPVGGAFHYVLLMPGLSVDTGRAYAALGRALTKPRGGIRIEAVESALEAGDVEHLSGCLYNSLQVAAFLVAPELGRLWRTLEPACRKAGCLALMVSGSGSTIFGATAGPQCALHVAQELSAQLRLRAEAVHSLASVSAQELAL